MEEEAPRADEQGMQYPIKIEVDHQRDHLDPRSRINLRARHCCQQNWQVYRIGRIADESWLTLLQHHAEAIRDPDLEPRGDMAIYHPTTGPQSAMEIMNPVALPRDEINQMTTQHSIYGHGGDLSINPTQMFANQSATNEVYPMFEEATGLPRSERRRRRRESEVIDPYSPPY